MLYAYGINFFLLLRSKEYIDWQKLWPLMVGGLPGIPLGIYFLEKYEDVMIKKIVGIVVVVFALWNLIARADRRHGLPLQARTT